MKLKITSTLLFLLFCIVIAFPGYGSSNIAKRKNATMYDHQPASMSSLIAVLKKCLAKGINMIEEERNTEEGDACHSVGALLFESATYQFLNIFSVPIVSFTDYRQTAYTPVCLIIFTPPDCIISC